MDSKNASVDPTTFGSDELTQLDIQKLQTAYDCSGMMLSGCGGHFAEATGTIVGSSSFSMCEWVINVGYGNIIEITFPVFSVSSVNTVRMQWF